MNETKCPICEYPENCKAYPHLWQRLSEDPARWKPIHDKLNGLSPEYPSLLEQAKNLGKSAVNFVKSGFAITDSGVYEKRLSICNNCPTNHFDRETGRCRACGCFVRTKARSEFEKCPLGHWEKNG